MGFTARDHIIIFSIEINSPFSLMIAEAFSQESIIAPPPTPPFGKWTLVIVITYYYVERKLIANERPLFFQRNK